MRLQAPYSKGFVEATGDLAERLIARGYKPVEDEKPQPKAPRKRTVKKEQ